MRLINDQTAQAGSPVLTNDETEAATHDIGLPVIISPPL